MKEVYLDGEDVQFSGDPPADLSALIEVISRHLSDNDRVLISCEVDGLEILPVSATPLPDEGTRICMVSSSIQTALARSIETVLSSKESLIQELHAFAIELLKQPWSESLKQMDTFSARLAPINHLLDTLLEYATRHHLFWQDVVAKAVKANEQHLNQFIQEARQQNVASVSDTIVNQLIPWTEATAEAFEQTIMPVLPLS